MHRPTPIYLDYHSTTPVHPEVVNAMLPYFTHEFGNAASRSHVFGWRANEAVGIARQQVARLMNVNQDEIYFNSGATEGLNFLIKGLAESLQYKGKHIITASTEHAAVLDPLEGLGRKGYSITKLGVGNNGLIDLNKLESSLTDDTLFVCLMWANNETGVMQDIMTIGQLCRQRGIILMSDTTQAIGKIEVQALASHVDMMVMSAHKFYGPKGSGAIWINNKHRKLFRIPLIQGGGHEKGLRSGTLNVPGIVGLGKAAEIIHGGLLGEMEKVEHLRNDFEKKILDEIEGAFVNGNTDKRLPSVTNIRLSHVDGEAVLSKIRNSLAISTGSACSSANPAPSHVLISMGLTPSQAKGSFRFSFGIPTTKDEAGKAFSLLKEAVDEYREQSHTWQMFKQGIDIPDA